MSLEVSERDSESKNEMIIRETDNDKREDTEREEQRAVKRDGDTRRVCPFSLALRSTGCLATMFLNPWVRTQRLPDAHETL